MDEYSPLILKTNFTFLQTYKEYVVGEWKLYYLLYDELKNLYKDIKDEKSTESKHEFIQVFEDKFLSEIQRVHSFLSSVVDDTNQELNDLQDSYNNYSGTGSVEKSEEEVRKFEKVIHSVFEKIKSCEEFYQLNKFTTLKIAKKYEKLLESDEKDKQPLSFGNENDFGYWPAQESHRSFTDDFCCLLDSIKELLEKCKRFYQKVCRKRYAFLTNDELQYTKYDGAEDAKQRLKFYLGVKIGLIISMVMWLITEFITNSKEKYYFWQPAFYVYTAIGNICLYRLTWMTVNVMTWEKYGIDYGTIFHFPSKSPDLLEQIDGSCTGMLFYMFSLVVFMLGGKSNRSDLASQLIIIAPIGLMVSFVVYLIRETFSSKGYLRTPGVFSWRVLLNCLKAPFIDPSFRDIYAADVLTSFSKIITDSCYAACWLISGSFLQSYSSGSTEKVNNLTYGSYEFGSFYMSCANHSMTIYVSCLAGFPQLIRFVQCLRCYYSSDFRQPHHLVNAGKYASSLLVIVVGITHSDTDVLFWVLICFATMYKWVWDVVMDWNLFDLERQWVYRVLGRLCTKPPPQTMPADAVQSSNSGSISTPMDYRRSMKLPMRSPAWSPVNKGDSKGDRSDATPWAAPRVLPLSIGPSMSPIPITERTYCSSASYCRCVRCEPNCLKCCYKFCQMNCEMLCSACSQLSQSYSHPHFHARTASYTPTSPPPHGSSSSSSFYGFSIRASSPTSPLEKHFPQTPPLFLRKFLIYPSTWWYYAAIVMDLILRYFWVISLVPQYGSHFSMMLGSVEVLRRSMWGLFRLEREHLVKLILELPHSKYARCRITTRGIKHPSDSVSHPLDERLDESVVLGLGLDATVGLEMGGFDHSEQDHSERSSEDNCDVSMSKGL